MKMNSFYIAALLVCQVALASCTDYAVKDPNFLPPDVVMNDNTDNDFILEGVPAPGVMQAYKPSLLGKPYRPITVNYSTEFPPVSKWTPANTRIVGYMGDYRPIVKSESDYKAIVNKYGSLTTGTKQAATGRFYVKKVDGRWWIIDPEGYPHYERSVTSMRYGSSARNREAWNKRFGTDAKWIATSQAELANIGFHGTGAFCTDTYSKIQTHNASNSDAPLTLTPSFGFLTQFKKQKNYDYPDNKSDSELGLGLVLYEGWADFCKEYVNTALAPYLNDANVLGFFSDNEITFSTQNMKILDSFYNLTNKENPAYLAAKKFMDEKGATSVTDNLNTEFAGQLAEIYYKAVKEAIKEADPGMMYLGTRLHGTPKYMKNVVEAAGKYCDIVSINYYSRWSPELDTYVKDWDTWANAPFLVTEFYTKGQDSDLNNLSGAGFTVPTQNDRAYAYQHFTLGLLEAKNCVGWHWFKYQDDDGTDNTNKPANKGVYDNKYEMYPYLAKFMQEVNYNVYNLIEYFDK